MAGHFWFSDQLGLHAPLVILFIMTTLPIAHHCIAKRIVRRFQVGCPIALTNMSQVANVLKLRFKENAQLWAYHLPQCIVEIETLPNP